jgi:hypothetical protein
MIHGSLCLLILLSTSVIEARGSNSRSESDWGKDIIFVLYCERNGNNPQTQAYSGILSTPLCPYPHKQKQLNHPKDLKQRTIDKRLIINRC